MYLIDSFHIFLLHFYLHMYLNYHMQYMYVHLVYGALSLRYIYAIFEKEHIMLGKPNRRSSSARIGKNQLAGKCKEFQKQETFYISAPKIIYQ